MSNAAMDSDVAVCDEDVAAPAAVASVYRPAPADPAPGAQAAPVVEAQPDARSDKFFVETVADPDAEFATKAFLLMQKITLSDDPFAQGVLVLPKHTPLYRYADQIRTAALMGVMVRNSPRDSLHDGAVVLYASYAAARDSLDRRVADFSASMQTRKQELLRDLSAG